MENDCPACGHPLRLRTDWLSYCQNCGLHRSTLQAGPGKAFEGLETLRRQNFEIILDRVSKLRPLEGARVLEIGCAKGWFLEAARARGAIPAGVEPVASDAAIARGRGFHVEEGLFPDSPADKGPYDLVVFNDVFEHLPDPASAAKATGDLLSPDGFAIINLPSSEGAIYGLARVLNKLGVHGPFERMWQKGLPSPHLTYFSPGNLRQLVERHSILREVQSFSVASVSRDGLTDRVSGRGVGVPAWLLLPAIWGLSFVLPLLPPDLHVGIFAKKN